MSDAWEGCRPVEVAACSARRDKGRDAAPGSETARLWLEVHPGPANGPADPQTTSNSSVWMRASLTPQSSRILIAAATIGPGPQMK